MWGSIRATVTTLLGALLVTAMVAGPASAAVTGQEHRTVETRDAADAQDDGDGLVQGDGIDDCVTGDLLVGNEIADGLIGVNCASTGNSSEVSFYGDGGFAYLVIIEPPADAPSKGVLANRGDYVHSSPGRSDAQLDRIWGKVEPLMSDEVGVTHQTPVTHQTTPLGETVKLPPGIYDVRVVVYEPTDNRGSGGGTPVTARTGAIRHSSTLRLAVGGCSIEPSPGEKLERLDRRKLELMEDIAQLRALYTEARLKFAAGTAAGTAVYAKDTLTIGKKVAKGGAKAAVREAKSRLKSKAKSEAKSALGIPQLPSIPGLSTIKNEVTDPAWKRRNELINRYYARTEEFRKVNREYSRTVERIQRCAGVTIPDSYEGITARERQRAKELNGWPYGDGREPNPYDTVASPSAAAAPYGDAVIPRIATSEGGR